MGKGLDQQALIIERILNPLLKVGVKLRKLVVDLFIAEEFQVIVHRFLEHIDRVE